MKKLGTHIKQLLTNPESSIKIVGLVVSIILAYSGITSNDPDQTQLAILSILGALALAQIIAHYQEIDRNKLLEKALSSMKSTGAICDFYTNRIDSRVSWQDKLGQVKKTLIVIGASAQVMITEVACIKKIAKNNGTVIIVVPKMNNDSALKFYEELIGAAGLPSGLDYMNVRYQKLMEELEKDGVTRPQERIILVKHKLGTPFGMTMYDPENQNHGLIRVEIYGPIADDRPSFDVSRTVNPALYEILGRQASDRLGFNPVQRSPGPDDIMRLLSQR